MIPAMPKRTFIRLNAGARRFTEPLPAAPRHLVWRDGDLDGGR
jgi:hypothetical protein